MKWNQEVQFVGPGTYQLIEGMFTMMAGMLVNEQPVWQSTDGTRFLFFGLSRDGKKMKWIVGDAVDKQAGRLVSTAGTEVSNKLMETQREVMRVEIEDKLEFISDASAKKTKTSHTAWGAALAYDWAIFVARPNEYAKHRNFSPDPATEKPFELSKLAPCTGLFFHPQLQFKNPTELTEEQIAHIIHNEAKMRTVEQLRGEAEGLIRSMPDLQYRKACTPTAMDIKVQDARKKRRANPVEKKKCDQGGKTGRGGGGPAGGGGGCASATGADQRLEQARDAVYAMISSYSATAKPLLPVPPPLLRGLQNDFTPAAGMAAGTPAAMAPMPALCRAASVGDQLDFGFNTLTADDMEDAHLQADVEELMDGGWMEGDDWQSRSLAGTADGAAAGLHGGDDDDDDFGFRGLSIQPKKASVAAEEQQEEQQVPQKTEQKQEQQDQDAVRATEEYQQQLHALLDEVFCVDEDSTGKAVADAGSGDDEDENEDGGWSSSDEDEEWSSSDEDKE
jgi:hypothetical protein